MNNAESTLATGIDADDTTVVVATGHGARFPAPGTDEYFDLTLVSADLATVEIMKATARSTDSITVVRAQQGTSGAAFSVGATVSHRLTKGALDELRDQLLDQRFTAGVYYPPSGYGSSVTQTTTNLRIHAVPFRVYKRQTFDRIAVYVSSGAASTAVRLGLYADTGGGKPGAKITDYGTVDSTTLGLKAITIAITLDAGWYWLVAQAEGGTPVLHMTQQQNQNIPPPDSSTNVVASWVKDSQTSGSLADPFPTDAVVNGNGPKIMLRAS
jgi:hypothetical protein